MTAEQLEASRAERMRQNGNGTLTLDDARTWIEETGFCLFMPRRQYSLSVAPSFVEAVAGQRNPSPDPKHVALADDLLVRLERDGVAVRLNLLGQVGEQPDYVVAVWVLPYVYALRGDRDWRRSPQLTGSRQVSPLAVQAYKNLENAESTVSELRHILGREVTDSAVQRAITELWQQLRIIPVLPAPNKAAKWQLLRVRYQKAIAEGASTSQVTAISVLASIYLQAVIAATMEDVEVFLAPLTARSKVREVLRGLVATRQVHTITLGHAPHYYVAGTLPEFAIPPTVYASTAMPASAYFMRAGEDDFHAPEVEKKPPVPSATPAESASPLPAAPASKPASTRPRFAVRSHDRKPAKPAARRNSSEARPGSGARWSSNGSRTASAGRNGGSRSSSNGSRNGHSSNSHSSNGHSAAEGRSSGSTWSKSNGHAKVAKPAAKAGTVRKEARPARSRKPVLGTRGKGATKRFGFAGRTKIGSRKRG